MAIRDVLLDPDPRLRARSSDVTAFDATLVRLVDDLLETMYAGSAIGLSAPQVGVPQRVVVFDASPSRGQPEIYVNPEVLAVDRVAWVEESCLSVPGVVATIKRPIQARVRARDVRGVPFERELGEMRAVCLLHEVDHLDGRLFTDHLPGWRRLMLRLRGRRPAVRVA
jgi:peptide deformylase